MITAEDIQRLVRLKAKDKDAFYKLLEELKSAHPLDHLLSYTRFKEYEPNVTISRRSDKAARAKAVRSKP
ncbi:MAG: hypothetical protein A4E28_02556 [Methanocella sp. PtaU1.Bin125]|nr:MAG: hypothetical protein A4E28_02556 [Methanocella sp. PtaU1.Bin125]